MRVVLAAEEVHLLEQQERRGRRPRARDVPALGDELRVVEVVDQAREPAHLAVDDPEVALARRRLEVPLEQDVREAEDAGERSPQVVRHRRDEVGLELDELAQALVLGDEVGDYGRVVSAMVARAAAQGFICGRRLDGVNRGRPGSSLGAGPLPLHASSVVWMSNISRFLPGVMTGVAFTRATLLRRPETALKRR